MKSDIIFESDNNNIDFDDIYIEKENRKNKFWLSSYILDNIGKNKGFILCINGKLASGKTMSSIALAEDIDQNFDNKRVVFSYKALKSLVDFGLPTASVIIWETDTLIIKVSKDKHNESLSELLKQIKEQSHILILTTNNVEYIDVEIRKLFDGYAETIIMEDNKVGWLKYFNVFVKNNKIYHRYPRVKTIDGRTQIIKGKNNDCANMYFGMSSEDIIKKYKIKMSGIMEIENLKGESVKYPKINTLWKRDEKNKHVIMPNEYSCEEFANIRYWHITEKVDGTNVRIFWDGVKVRFGGRTDNAQMPTYLLSYLQDTFTIEKMKEAFPDILPDLHEEIVLFGEGYGAKIQKGGGNYRDDVSFILFDVYIESWWLNRDSVTDIAKKLGIDEVPTLGVWGVNQIQDFVKNKPESTIAQKEKISEGIVARSHPLVLFRDGTPVMFKLKVVDYEKLEKFGVKE